MSLKSSIAMIPIARQVAIKLLQITAKDIHLKNAWTGDLLYLNSFKHKGYWFFGKDREKCTMEAFKKFVSEGDTVLELGGHIGFITQYFSKLVGESGNVIVFEPGRNNWPYIDKNTASKSNIKVEKIAVSNESGVATFFEDNISGQNNSLLPDYKEAVYVASTHAIKLEKREFEVTIITIDDYVQQNKIDPSFIKIDIEGNELNALNGALITLKKINALMVEVTENHEGVSRLLKESGFELYDERGNALSEIKGNVFAVRSAPGPNQA